MRQFYIVENEQQSGPFSIEELKRKNITASSLVWEEEMDDWTEAKNIIDLKDIIIKLPPPIPKKSEKTIKVEAEIKKRKERLINPKTEITAAKEIKINFRLVVLALVIGVVSYPVHFAIDKGFAHLRLHKKWDYILLKENFNWDKASEEAANKKLEEWKQLKNQSRSLGWVEGQSGYADEYHERKYKKAAEKDIWVSIITWISVSVILIFGRYLIKGINWVNSTSKKK